MLPLVQEDSSGLTAEVVHMMRYLTSRMCSNLRNNVSGVFVQDNAIAFGLEWERVVFNERAGFSCGSESRGNATVCYMASR